MYKIRIMQIDSKESSVMWIVSDMFTTDVYFMENEVDNEFGPYAGNDIGWQESIWFKYL